MPSPEGSNIVVSSIDEITLFVNTLTIHVLWFFGVHGFNTAARLQNWLRLSQLSM